MGKQPSQASWSPPETIVDGYNLLLKWRRGGLKRGPGNLERAREALLHWLARRFDQPKTLTVVFDVRSQPPVGMADARFQGMRVVFAEGYSTADDWIIEECRSRARTHRITVITSDRGLEHAVTRSGAAVISSEEFIAQLHSDDEADHSPDRPTERSTPPDDSPNLDGKDLEEFRAAMTGEVLPPSPEPKRNPGPTPKPKTEMPSHPDWSEFLRDMREGLKDEDDGRKD